MARPPPKVQTPIFAKVINKLENKDSSMRNCDRVASRMRQGIRDRVDMENFCVERSSNSCCHKVATASEGIRQSPPKSGEFWVPYGNFPSSGRVNRPCGKILQRQNLGAATGSVRKWKAYRSSNSCCHKVATASEGIRQSPRGLRVAEPTLGPSGTQERLNC